MGDKRVLIVDPVFKGAASILVDEKQLDVSVYRPGRDGTLADAIGDYDGLLISETSLDRTTIRKGAAGKLRIISSVGRSVSHLDIKAAADAKVVVLHAPGYEANALAEYALGMVFALSRKLPQGERLLREGKSFARHRLQGEELAGKTLGILGMNEEGQLLAKKSAALGMDIVLHDYSLPLKDRHDLAQSIGARYASLDELLRESDYVASLLPEDKQSVNLIGKRELSLMKASSSLITLTPALADEKVLYEALSRGVISGIALDIPLSKRSGLLTLENVVATPGLAGLSSETRRRQEVLAAVQLRDALLKGAYRNVVTPR